MTLDSTLIDQGFRGDKFRIRSVDELPMLDVVIPEDDVSPVHLHS